MLLGFVVPIGIALFSYSSFVRDIPFIESLGNDDAGSRVSYERLESPLNDSLRKENFSSTASDPVLDPLPGKSFLTAIKFSLEELPTVGARQKIIAKYETRKIPYSGWAMAFFRDATSTRPALYWKGVNGKGKWFLFADVSLAVSQSYEFSFVVNKEKQLMGFWKHIEGSEDAAPAFIGGYDLSKIQLPSSSAPLYFGVKGNRDSSFRGLVDRVVVASLPEQMSSRREVAKLLVSPLEDISKNIPKESVFLEVDKNGQDLSVYSREIAQRTNI